MKRRIDLIILVVLIVGLISACDPLKGELFYVRPTVIDESGNTVTINRKWLSHRGVDLNCTIAGENSLEAVALAKKVGFESIETDVRATSDDVLVCMHDETINRTCTYKDGSAIKELTKVSDLTLDELKANYRLKANQEDMRTRVPTLEEYLNCCKANGLLVFIEPKLRDSTGENYRRIMEIADKILGREGYIITSNNYANEVIRNTLKIQDVKVMTILYQTTYEAVQALGNSIMAISTVRFSKE